MGYVWILEGLPLHNVVLYQKLLAKQNIKFRNVVFAKVSVDCTTEQWKSVKDNSISLTCFLGLSCAENFQVSWPAVTSLGKSGLSATTVSLCPTMIEQGCFVENS